jgi:hypothetical protein
MDDSAPQPQTENPQEQPPVPVPPLSIPIEETPEIPMDTTAPSPPPRADGQPPPARGRVSGKFGLIIVLILVFIGGIWLSGYIRQFMPNNAGSPAGTTQNVVEIPTPALTETSESGMYTTWPVYSVISGTTKLPIPGISFQLPPDVLSPICDGTACTSQGTYLPGGTRFTVAPRGTGQSLRDFRGTVISDTSGNPFLTKPVTIGGLSATEFTGSFTGRTISGYAFSQMRGVMIPVSDNLSLEVNHFTPSGIVSDFAADETVFDSILKTFVIENATQKGAVIPTATVLPLPTSATSSGY